MRVTHGLAETLEQMESEDASFVDRVAAFIDSLISHYVLDGGRLVVAHAGLKEEYQGRASGRVRSFCLYGDTTGETDEYGLPVRLPWARDYRGSAMVVYGHTPTLEPEWVNNTICIDTGAVFGGTLTALRYPERELVAVPAHRMYYEPAKPLAATRPTHDRGTADVLALSDVVGRRSLDTGYGRVTVPAENAAAALEVMGRFAIDPAALLWLPPTMAPCSTSAVDGYLEHPSDAFADYRRAGVTQVVCEEKHMGSRAVVLVRRDGSGVAYTRTGRPFFPQPSLNAALVARAATAVDGAGLFEELGSEWVLLDTELLPWSAKATGLIQEQYASVGAAARGALPAALAVLDAAQARGLAVGPIRDRLAARLDGAVRFTEVYRRYCWPTDGLAGMRLAPFQVLAGERASYLGRDHGWHLARCDRLVAADGELFLTTERRTLDLTDETAVAEATQWWLSRTEAGGEGMVVKPFAGVAPPRGSAAGPARHQVPRSGVPSDHLRGRLHRAGAAGASARSQARAQTSTRGPRARVGSRRAEPPGGGRATVANPPAGLRHPRVRVRTGGPPPLARLRWQHRYPGSPWRPLPFWPSPTPSPSTRSTPPS